MATFTVRGRNMEVTPALKDYVEKRVGKIAKYFDKVGEITVLLTVSKGRHTVEVTVPIDKGVMLRGEEATMDMYTSIDLVVEKLERQIHKHKTKLQRRFREGGFKAELAAEESKAAQVRAGVAAEEVEPRVALGGVGAPLLLGVDVVEDPPARRGVGAQAVDNVHGGLRVKAHVPGVAEAAQRVAAPVPALGWEQQPVRLP